MATPERQQAFFRSFHAAFLQAFPLTRSTFFRHYDSLTDDAPLPESWNRQFQELKEAILLLLVFSSLREDRQEPNLLTRIVESHQQLGVPSWMYNAFGKLLIDCICEHDVPPPPLNAMELRRAWTCIVEPGIDYMRRRTDELAEVAWRRESAAPEEFHVGATSAPAKTTTAL